MNKHPAQSISQNNKTAEDIRVEASELQSLAANPARNIWVNASAGTGKTKVLTQRVLRLLLPRDGVPDGTPPDNILCITFTKAGANEMISRIMAVLSKWSVCNEAELKRQLDELLETEATVHQIDRARRLFARVIDLPNGLNVTTIHAFCQSILGRFTIEANLPPNFSLIEEADSKSLLRNVRDQMIHECLDHQSDPDVKEAFSYLATIKSSGEIQSILQSIAADRNKLIAFLGKHGEDTMLPLAQLTGIDPNTSEETIFDSYFSDDHFPSDAIKQLARAFEHGTKVNAEKAPTLYDFCAATENYRKDMLAAYNKIFLTEGEIRKTPLTQSAKKYDPQAMDIFTAEAIRLQRYIDAINSLSIIKATNHLLIIARNMLQRYEESKAISRKIDFDDLIHKTFRLLNGPLRQWVLYKLDHRIDHILLDEAQDTSPEQWQIIRAILEEFTGGESVRGDQTDTPRTLFVVGDNKQSIFSFQGADTKTFNHVHEQLKQSFTASKQSWHDVPMNTSFRSTPAVLDFVDCVFNSDVLKTSLSVHPDYYKPHTAWRQGHAGRIDLWPLYKAEKTTRTPWTLPLSVTEKRNSQKMLAQKIADQISEWILQKAPLPAKGRPIHAGDIMILVRRRNTLVDHLVRALKANCVPVSGVDRLKIAAHIAVKDILIALQFALMPADDLALATLLKSPFIGWDDAAIEKYAYGRQTSLWNIIKSSAADDIGEWLSTLIKTVGGQNAFTAISNLLTLPTPCHGLTGWQAMTARMGEDCRDPLEELLTQAQHYDADHPGSGIQGFIHALQHDTSDIKREMEEAEGKVRIMTVHASKGLQAPIVILPDTTAMPKANGQSKDGFLWIDADGGDIIPLWSPKPEDDSDFVKAHKENLKQATLDEYHRLLYVALTRAEDRLIICGTLPGNSNNLPEESWYNLAEKALRSMEHTKVIAVNNPEEAAYLQHEANQDYLYFETQQTAGIQAGHQKDTLSHIAPLPLWATQNPAAEQYPPRILKPSQDQDDAIPVRSPLAAADDLYRFRRGILTHALLQYLPDLPQKNRLNAGGAYLSRHAPDLPQEVQQSILNETMAILTAPQFAAFFGEGSMAEVPITGTIRNQDGRTDIISGQIDRLLIQEKDIWIIDFKSNRPPPKDPAKIPDQYRKQLASYRSLIEQIYPHHTVHCALLWTDGPFMSVIP